MRLSPVLNVALLSLMLAACGPPPRQPSGLQSEAPSRPESARTLVFVARSEPENLAGSGGIGTAGGTTRRFFTATLAMSDDLGTPLPFLAEALPTLNTDSWRLLADGHMETTYRLRPNLTWHDSVPFTAQDLVFTWRALTTSELGQAGLPPQSVMEEVTSADDRTVVIMWKRPFPQAGTLADDLRPLPRHLLEPLLQTGQPDAWENHVLGSSEPVVEAALKG